MARVLKLCSSIMKGMRGFSSGREKTMASLGVFQGMRGVSSGREKTMASLGVFQTGGFIRMPSRPSQFFKYGNITHNMMISRRLSCDNPNDIENLSVVTQTELSVDIGFGAEGHREGIRVAVLRSRMSVEVDSKICFPLPTYTSATGLGQIPFPQNVGRNSIIKDEKLGRPERRQINTPAKNFIVFRGNIAQGLKSVESIYMTHRFITHSYGLHSNGIEDDMRASGNAISSDKDACSTTLEIINSKHDSTGEIVNISCESRTSEIPDNTMDDVEPMYILPSSSHRDGSLYNDTHSWKRDFRTADRNETRLEAMMFSDPTDCIIYRGTCIKHVSLNMLQIFSLRLAKIAGNHGPVELYGYIATRDSLEPLLNYVVNFSRDDPFIVEQGSLISMTGPKRGIMMVDTTLIEYDMKIKTGKHKKEDLQLIDGVSTIDDIDTWNCSPFRCRIHGDCGAIDLVASRLNAAVEATIQVVIAQVKGCFNMCLSCFTSGIHEEIRLFDGAISESGSLKRFVVAVVLGAQMDLKFKVGADSYIPSEHYCCSFKANSHGHATQEMKTDFAFMAVKVTWSTLGKWPKSKYKKHRKCL